MKHTKVTEQEMAYGDLEEVPTPTAREDLKENDTIDNDLM